MALPANVTEVFLQPGEFHFGHAKTRIKTILGSCVAITMWHPILHIGGMCHFLLPSRDTRASERLDGRYGSDALQLFLQEMARKGTTLKEYQVKVFGGGDMFPSLDKRGKALEIGMRNVELARKALEDLGVPVAAEHVGDVGHRQVIFDVWSGDVWVRHQRIPANGGPNVVGVA
ncbi:chemotaxis protein CheD [Nitrospira lenta]|uniref:Probable chemoreceptor glutamine deamidase CheD n=1 Tax=Nitrospira lenta TaxID=1436998 RepID=A0A330L7P0_9BACT|nr:chemotaxis protein CheD [Nitrospira lenta]SPP65005.1 putative chemoreceptor glutamine deamidase CheD 3 [Nitrospira lenta]